MAFFIIIEQRILRYLPELIQKRWQFNSIGKYADLFDVDTKLNFEIHNIIFSVGL